MVAEVARYSRTGDLPISGIGGITPWRDAAEQTAPGCGAAQICTAAMVQRLRIIEELTSGLEAWTPGGGYEHLSDFRGRPVETRSTGTTWTSTTPPRDRPTGTSFRAAVSGTSLERDRIRRTTGPITPSGTSSNSG